MTLSVGIDFSKLARAEQAKDEVPPCPNCQSTEVWPILWGMPDGRPPPRHVVGGCMVHGDGSDPRWEYQDCKHRFGRRIDGR